MKRRKLDDTSKSVKKFSPKTNLTTVKSILHKPVGKDFTIQKKFPKSEYQRLNVNADWNGVLEYDWVY